MCFGNNPGCRCCAQLPQWEIGANGETFYRQSLNEVLASDYDLALFNGTRGEWQGELYYDFNFLRPAASRSYDVVYAHGNSPGQNWIRQYRADNGTTINWQENTLPPETAEGVSTGDHGLILIDWRNHTTAWWIDKEGAWVNTPKALDTTAHVKIGASTYTASNALVRISKNSPHAAVRYYDGGSTHIAIGTFSLIPAGANWTVEVVPSYTYDLDASLSHTATDGQVGMGDNDTLYWSFGGGAGGIDTVKLPGLGVFEYGPTNYSFGGCGYQNTSLCILDFWPGNIMTWKVKSKCILGSTALAFWGTTHMDGLLRSHITNDSVFRLFNGATNITPIPVASRWAFEIFWDPGKPFAAQPSHLFPGIADIDDFIEAGSLDMNKYYVGIDHKDLTYREPYNRFAAIAYKNVILADTLPVTDSTKLSSTRVSATPLVGTTANFLLDFQNERTGAAIGDLYDITDGGEPSAADFAVYVEGSVAYTGTSIAEVTPSQYTFQVTGVDGGLDGGYISITVANPSTLVSDKLVPLSGAPLEIERIQVPAAP